MNGWTSPYLWCIYTVATNHPWFRYNLNPPPFVDVTQCDREGNVARTHWLDEKWNNRIISLDKLTHLTVTTTHLYCPANRPWFRHIPTPPRPGRMILWDGNAMSFQKWEMRHQKTWITKTPLVYSGGGGLWRSKGRWWLGVYVVRRAGVSCVIRTCGLANS